MSIGSTYFHTQLGKTLEGWSYVESCLCSFFIKVTQTHPPLGRKLFYSSAGFRFRARMLRIAIDCVNLTEEGMREFWQDAIAKADSYSTFRNLMVHGDIVFVDFAGSKYCGKHIILQGREPWKADPDPKDVITLERLAISDQSFRLLASCMMSVLGGGSQPNTPGPMQCRDLISLLPNKPHSNQLGQSDLARFSQFQSVPFDR